MENTEARRRFDEQFVRSHIRIFRYIAALVPNRDDAEEVFQRHLPESPGKMAGLRSGPANGALGLRDCAEHGAEVLRAEPASRGLFERDRHRGRLRDARPEVSEVNRRLQELPGCLQKLTEQQRALLERCYQRPGSIKAIAEASQLDPNTLYKQLERIRRDLFECIERASTVE